MPMVRAAGHGAGPTAGRVPRLVAGLNDGEGHAALVEPGEGNDDGELVRYERIRAATTSAPRRAIATMTVSFHEWREESHRLHRGFQYGFVIAHRWHCISTPPTSPRTTPRCHREARKARHKAGSDPV